MQNPDIQKSDLETRMYIICTYMQNCFTKNIDKHRTLIDRTPIYMFIEPNIMELCYMQDFEICRTSIYVEFRYTKPRNIQFRNIYRSSIYRGFIYRHKPTIHRTNANATRLLPVRCVGTALFNFQGRREIAEKILHIFVKMEMSQRSHSDQGVATSSHGVESQGVLLVIVCALTALLLHALRFHGVMKITYKLGRGALTSQRTPYNLRASATDKHSARTGTSVRACGAPAPLWETLQW